MAGKPKLTPKQAAFVAEYQKDMNATQAAIRAGYSEATAMQAGSRLLRHVEVNKALVEVDSKAVERASVSIALDEAAGTAAWVTAQAVEAVEFGFAKVPTRTMFGEVIKDESGAPVLRFRDPKTATTNLALLAKRHAEFSDKHDVNVDLTARIEALAAITTMSPEQLRELAGGARG